MVGEVFGLEYIIYCDESSSKGSRFSDFYGGCIVKTSDVSSITAHLNSMKSQLNLHGELKWTKVSENYLDKYMKIIDCFFEYVYSGKIKVRIMFRDTNPENDAHYTVVRKNEKYFKLYYQFIKHAFGLAYYSDSPTKLRIYLDQLPDKKDECEKFKEYLRNLQNIDGFRHIHILGDDIAEISSHNHVVLQCVDVILGAMYFRLNHLHKHIPEGQKRRGKRTVAKERLYNHIYRHINEIYPHFNIGISTGPHGTTCPSRDLKYSHWKFVPHQK